MTQTTFDLNRDDDTISMLVWTASFTLAVSLQVVMAALGAADLHAYIALMIAAVVTAVALRADYVNAGRETAPGERTSSLARYVGILWAWSATVMTISYGTGIAFWASWWQYMLASAAVAVMCLCFSNLLRSAEAKDVSPERIRMLSFYFAIIQVVAAGILISAIVLSGSFDRLGFLLGSATSATKGDWVAINMVVFNGIGVMFLGLGALRTIPKAERNAAPATSAEAC